MTASRCNGIIQNGVQHTLLRLQALYMNILQLCIDKQYELKGRVHSFIPLFIYLFIYFIYLFIIDDKERALVYCPWRC